MTPREKAIELRRKLSKIDDDASDVDEGFWAGVDLLTSALTVPDNHVRGPDGVDRRVLGKPSINADGDYVFPGATVVVIEPESYLDNRPNMVLPEYPDKKYITTIYENKGLAHGMQDDNVTDWQVDECFTTEQSAEAALAARTPQPEEKGEKDA